MWKNQENIWWHSWEKLDSLVCELWVMMVDKLRYTRFISTKELEKLKTCKNLHELDIYFEMEKKILEMLFSQNPSLKRQKSFSKEISLEIENEPILNLIQEYTSIDYIRANTTNFDDENVKWVKLYIKRDSQNRFYISNIEIVNK